LPSRPSLAHVDVVVTSLERSLPFYRALIGHLGALEEHEVRGERGETIHYLSAKDCRGALGVRERQSDVHPVPYDRYAVGIHHVALSAPSREAVDAVEKWIRETGASLESPSREYDYSPGYYAVFLHDPDGLKVEVVHRRGWS
jgi:glyoxylase I family protein